MSNPAVTKDKRSTKHNAYTLILNRIGIYAVIILLVIIGAIVAPGTFLTVDNFGSIVQAVALLGMSAVGISFVVYSSNFNDMSAPMTISFSGMIAVATLGLGFWPAVILGVLAGMSMGIVNGFLIGKFRAHPIIWTLAFNFVMSGLVRWAWSGRQIYPTDTAANNPRAAELFISISRSDILGVPIMVVVMILMFIVGQFILTRTKFGNELKIVGSNYQAAKLSGINVTRSTITVYLIAAFCAAICGIFLSSMAQTGAFFLGDGYDFRGVTAVLLGGMTLAGGKGNLIGVFGGVISLGMLTNIMNLIGVPTFNQWFVQGLVFLFIVWLNSFSDRKLGKS